jgi:hypothetical protein
MEEEHQRNWSETGPPWFMHCRNNWGQCGYTSVSFVPITTKMFRGTWQLASKPRIGDPKHVIHSRCTSWHFLQYIAISCDPHILQYHVIRIFLQHPQSQINMQLWLWRCSSRFPGWNLESPGTSCLTQLDFRCMDRREPVNTRSFLLWSLVLPSLPCLFFSAPAHVWHATWSHSQIGGDTQWFWLRRFKYAHVSVDVYVHEPTYS